MRRIGIGVVGAALLAGTPALAELRDLCPERPGLNTPPCIVDKGHLLVEVGLVDWTLEKSADERTDTFLIGDTVVRLGIGDTTELQLGWTPIGHVRDKDRISGQVDRATRIGDAFVGIKQNLVSPDGSGFSVALDAQAQLSVGKSPIGAGDWGASFLVPISYDLGHGIALQATPEVDAAVDEDGDGRHLAYGSVIGLGIDVSKQVSVALEAQATRDRDPDGHSTELLASASIGWQPSDDVQFDVAAVAGLNRNSPDLELYVGVSRRF